MLILPQFYANTVLHIGSKIPVSQLLHTQGLCNVLEGGRVWLVCNIQLMFAQRYGKINHG